MENSGVILHAQLADWPTKDEMTSILRAAGLRIVVGRYSIRIEDCSHFSFEHYGGDICEPSVVADCDTLEKMLLDAKLVSAALSNGGIKHRFEVYNSADEMIGYMHFDWPRTDV